MNRIFRTFFICSSCLLVVYLTGCAVGGRQEVSTEMENPSASEMVILDTNSVDLDTASVSSPAAGLTQAEPFADPDGMVLEERIRVPDGFTRIFSDTGSFQSYLRQYEMKPEGSPVLLYDGREKASQTAHAAVFAMPVFDSDLQQCADSIIRIYAEYFWSIGAYDRIMFHLTNGFPMDYLSWREGNRLSVEGNHVSYIKTKAYDDSRESFLLYLQYVMMYAGTLSLDEESSAIKGSQLQAGDMFIRGGSPGHCVMVADVTEDADGNLCFLLAQGYMPAQDFHILNNPLHDEDPWYYVSELSYPFLTPEYTFQEGSLKRFYGF